MQSIESILKELFTLANTHRDALISLTLLGVGFLIYLYLSDYLKNRINSNLADETKASYYGYIIQRLIGFITLGLIPILIFKISVCKPLWAFGFNLNNLSTSLLWTGILGGLIILINSLVAGKKSNLEQYPQIRISKWNAQKFSINSITWIMYLFGYEFMFRGILLFSFYHTFGLSFAITANTILYALVHLPKGRKETLGSIPLGIILCILSIYTGSFFLAFLFHVIMALSNDYFSIRYNPEMHIKIS